MSIGETLKSYVWWTHPRGGFHYDVMVTVILAFIFLTPGSVFKDKPQKRQPSAGQYLVTPDGQSGFVYELNASAVASDESDVQGALKRTVESMAGPVNVIGYEEQRDNTGKVIGYRVHVRRQ